MHFKCFPGSTCNASRIACFVVPQRIRGLVITLLEIQISQMFPRPGVQRDYSEGEKEIFLCGNNVELPLRC